LNYKFRLVSHACRTISGHSIVRAKAVALFFEDDDCPLCGATLAAPIYATTHFIHDETHPLWRFSDAAMHWDCYAKWPEQVEFAELYFASTRAFAEGNTHWPIIAETDGVLVRYGVAVDEVSVVLRRSGSELRVSRADWSRWLDGRYEQACAHSLERRALEEALDFLRKVQLP
jgi:hypothetical protein